MAEKNRTFYAYDTASFGEQWELTGGLRAEKYTVEIDSKTAAGVSNGAFDGYEEDDFNLGGKVGLVYKPVANGSVYAAFGVAAQPPGSFLSNADISRTGDNAFPGLVEGAKGVTSYNYEVGVKWDFFGGTLSTTAALFRTEKKDVPITGRDPGETVDTLKGYGEWGRVELTTLTQEFFMPRFLERDEALRRGPRHPYAWDGVAEVRPFGAMEKTIVEGVY